MNQNKEVEKRIICAMDRLTPKEPNKHELGGGIYYTCHWEKCDTELKLWMNYCPVCGQRIGWSFNKNENDIFGFCPWQE